MASFQDNCHIFTKYIRNLIDKRTSVPEHCL